MYGVESSSLPSPASSQGEEDSSSTPVLLLESQMEEMAGVAAALVQSMPQLKKDVNKEVEVSQFMYFLCNGDVLYALSRRRSIS